MIAEISATASGSGTLVATFSPSMVSVRVNPERVDQPGAAVMSKRSTLDASTVPLASTMLPRAP